MTPRYTPGYNATAVFRALADLFVVHEIPATPIGVCGRHRCFSGGDVGRRQQAFLALLSGKAQIEVYKQSYEQNRN